MDNSKSFFMGGLSLKPTPKIVTKNDNKTILNRYNKIDLRNSNKLNSNLNNNNNNLRFNQQTQNSSILSGSNSLNQNISNKPIIYSTTKQLQFIKHAENILKQQRPLQQKPISLLLQKTGQQPVKMQSLLQKRSILNTMNSNLIANHHNSNNLLINSLMKTTMSNNLNSIQQDKQQSSTADKIDDKMIKIIKICVTKLEFSSPLFKRIATKMTFLYIKPTYEHIKNYERFCSTSNKAVLKQVMNKGHTLKYKPSRNGSRMLRSNEIVDGKVMISWQRRSSYVHVYTFNRRQRLRRYRQISMDLGFEHRTLQIMYGLKKVTIPRIIECPFCKKQLTPDLGHYCVVARKTTKRLRSSKSTSLLKQTNKQIKQLQNDIQTSDYVSNESDNSSMDLNNFRSTRSSLLDDSSKINLVKLDSNLVDDNLDRISTIKRCPTLLLDSSNYKTNQNSNVIVRRMDSKELNKKATTLLQSSPNKQQQQNGSNLDKLRIKKVNTSLPVKNLIKCSVMDQHNFDVSLENSLNSIKIVFK